MRLVFLLVVILGVTAAKKKPNVVIFLADDLGIGDVGCFGNTTIKTPNIDRIANEGIKLTHHLAGASYCTPSRAALLTGRYPVRSGMTATANGLLRFFLYLAQSGGLPPNETTFAELAKTVGYKTALIGKWHLGLHKEEYGDNIHNPINQGFDYYYGIPLTNLKDFGDEGALAADGHFPRIHLRFLTMVYHIVMPLLLLYRHDVIKSRLLLIILMALCSSPVLGFYWILNNYTILNSVLVRNTEVVEHPIILQNLTHRFAKEGVDFITERAQSKEPFLLMMSWQLVHTHIITHPAFKGSPHGRYGDGVEELDWGTGEILKALDRTGLAADTFVYFSSDNGGHLEEKGVHGEQDGGWNGIYKGGKTHGSVDGGIRVPTAARWPGRIPPNSVTNEPTMFLDVLPTVANIMGAKIPTDRIIDGKDMMPLLSGKQKQTSSKFLVHYCGDAIHAVRYRPNSGTTIWKLVFYEPDYIEGTQQCLFLCSCYTAVKLNPPKLHDMTKDPSEKYPVNYTNDQKLNAIVEKMTAEKISHEKSIEQVPHQFSRTNTLWRPHLQPCCGGIFPFCNCKEDSIFTS